MKIRKFIAGASFFGILLGMVFVQSVHASGSLPLTGWAWSDTIGWISFNSSDAGTGTNGTGTSAVAYGVNMDLVTGNLSGDAWTPNIGWISFNSSEVAGCPQTDSQNPTCQPNINTSTGAVTGWARALSAVGNEAQGWDGWISLSGSNDATAHADGSQGVTYTTTTISGTTINPLVGYAWGGGTANGGVIGWIQFNPPGGGVYVGTNGSSLGSVNIETKMADSNFSTAGVPSGAETWIASPSTTYSATATNPAYWLNIPNASYMAYASYEPGYTVDYDYCYYTGSPECSMTTQTSYVSATLSNGSYAVSVPISGNNVTKVVFEYIQSGSNGEIETKMADSNFSTAGVPSGAETAIDSQSFTQTNPFYWQNISAGSHSVFALPVLPGYNVYSAMCQYAIGGQECSMTDPSYYTELLSPSGTAPNQEYATTTTVSAGMTNKIVFEYVQTASYTLSVTPTGAGSGEVTSSDEKIACSYNPAANPTTSGTCQATYPANTAISLSSNSSSGSNFTAWGGVCSGNGSCAVTLTGNSTVTAEFEPPYQCTGTCGGSGNSPPGNGGTVTYGTINLSWNVANLPTGATFDSTITGSIDSSARCTLSEQGTGPTSPLTCSNLAASPYYHEVEISNLGPGYSVLATETVGGVAQAQPVISSCSDQSDYCIDGITVNSTSPTSIDVIYTYVGTNGSSLGSVNIETKMADSNFSTAGVPSGAETWIASPSTTYSATATNPAYWLNIPNASYMAYASYEPGYTVDYDYCYYTGSPECSMTTQTSYVSATLSNGSYAVSVPISGNNVTKVVFEYIQSGSNGEIETKMADSNFSTAGVPSGAETAIDSQSFTQTNPFYWQNISAGSHSVFALPVLPGYNVYSAMCQYAIGGQECSMTDPSYYTELLSPSGTAPNQEYATTTTVSAGMTNKIVFEYVQTASYTLSVTPTGAGSGEVTSSDEKIACSYNPAANPTTSGTCQATYPANTAISLSSNSSSGSNFTAWGGVCSGNGSCAVTLTGNSTVTAEFEPPYQCTGTCGGSGNSPPGNGGTVTYGTINLSWNVANLPTGATFDSTITGSIDSSARCTLSEQGTGPTSPLTCSNLAASPYYHEVEISNLGPGYSVLATETVGGVAQAQPVISSCSDQSDYCIDGITVNSTSPTSIDVIYTYVGTNGSSLGSVNIETKMADSNFSTAGVPSGAETWIASPSTTYSATATNPAYWLNIPNASYMAYASYEPGYTVDYDYCYYTGSPECSMTTQTSYVSATLSNGSYAVSVPISGNNVTKVVFEYIQSGSNGEIETKMADSNFSTAGVPSGAETAIDSQSFTQTNPFYWQNISAGSHSVFALPVLPGYNVYSAMCQYAIGGQECSMTDPSYYTELLSPSGTAPNQEYATTTTVSAGMTNKIVFEYVQTASYTLSVTPTGAGSGEVTSSDEKIACSYNPAANPTTSGTCQATYPANTAISLSSNSSSGSNFTAWGGVCSGNGSCAVTLTGNSTVTAEFEPPYQCTGTCGGSGNSPPGNGGTVTYGTINLSWNVANLPTGATFDSTITGSIDSSARCTLSEQGTGPTSPLTCSNLAASPYYHEVEISNLGPGYSVLATETVGGVAQAQPVISSCSDQSDYCIDGITVNSTSPTSIDVIYTYVGCASTCGGGNPDAPVCQVTQTPVSVGSTVVWTMSYDSTGIGPYNWYNSSGGAVTGSSIGSGNVFQNTYSTVGTKRLQVEDVSTGLPSNVCSVIIFAKPTFTEK